jgi:hypothetical protein
LSSAGLPATVARIRQSAEGLPIGVQIIGPYLEDRTTDGPAAFDQGSILAVELSRSDGGKTGRLQL